MQNVTQSAKHNSTQNSKIGDEMPQKSASQAITLRQYKMQNTTRSTIPHHKAD